MLRIALSALASAAIIGLLCWLRTVRPGFQAGMVGAALAIAVWAVSLAVL
jgi:hypothetical protein